MKSETPFSFFCKGTIRKCICYVLITSLILRYNSYHWLGTSYMPGTPGLRTPKPMHLLLPSWEHTDFSCSCGWLPSHLQISAPGPPAQRSFAWTIDLLASFIKDWPFPSEHSLHWSLFAQMDQCLGRPLDSCLCSQHSALGLTQRSLSKPVGGRIGTVTD